MVVICQPCDELVTYPGCTQPLAQCQLGLAAATKWHDKLTCVFVKYLVEEGW